MSKTLTIQLQEAAKNKAEKYFDILPTSIVNDEKVICLTKESMYALLFNNMAEGSEIAIRKVFENSK